MENLENEITILDEILNFKIEEIPSNTRFWMIRTKKGYFYDEFINKKFVALAWNIITKETSFSESNEENLRDTILLEYQEIHRPKTVINKCKCFINEVKKGDYLVIPSKNSQFITFAIAGDYFEDEQKTIELEKLVIEKIESKQVCIDDVSCPYRKRRRITPIRTVKSEDINYNLYRAISNYHGISNLDNYSNYILNMIYGIYSFKNDVNIVFNVRKEDMISPRDLSGFLYYVTDYLCEIGIEESKIATKVNINSPGPIYFTAVEAFNFLKNNYLPILGLLVVIGGGNFLTFKLPGIPQVIKDILSIPTDLKRNKLETEILEMQVQEKKIEVYEKIKSIGVDPVKLDKTLESIGNNATKLKIEPIETIDVKKQINIENMQENVSEDE